ncbi:MAG: hypothetical protein ABW250_12205 [Pyrinomonadaceae bacterium]
MSNQFSPGAATQIAHKCTVATTGNNHPLSPSHTLGDYGVFGSPQISLIKTRIRTDGNIGLPHFGRAIDPNALKDLDTDWTIMKLATVIFDQSFDSGVADLEFAADASRSVSAPARPRANALTEFAQENPTQAMMMSAAAGMMLGFILGRILR